MPHRLPCLLNDPPPAAGRTWFANARVFDGTTAPVRERAAVLVEDGRIAAIAGAGEAPPEGARVIDVEGRTLMPGLIDAHQHATAGSHYFCKSANQAGTEDIWPGAAAHVVAQVFRELLRMGITTFRDVGGYDDLLVEARQAMRYGAFDGPRVLACGRIVSATSPGGRFFPGMYREADGADEIRKAVREQMRYGADFIKVMTTGARSVELEDPDPAQLTRDEVHVLVEESHRMGYRVAAHCEGMAGTEIAIEEGIDTIEHGMYLNQRPELLERMARDGQVLVPTRELPLRRGRPRRAHRHEPRGRGVPGRRGRRHQAPADADLDAAARRPRDVQRRAVRAHDPGGARRRRDDRDGLRLGPGAPQRARAACA